MTTSGRITYRSKSALGLGGRVELELVCEGDESKFEATTNGTLRSVPVAHEEFDRIARDLMGAFQSEDCSEESVMGELDIEINADVTVDGVSEWRIVKLRGGHTKSRRLERVMREMTDMLTRLDRTLR